MDDFSVFMDHRQAWRDFFDSVRPAIWARLSRDERRIINTAEADYWGKRGKSLGPDRVEGLLGRFAPGVYGVERVVRFWRNPTPDPSPEGRGDGEGD